MAYSILSKKGIYGLMESKEGQLESGTQTLLAHCCDLFIAHLSVCHLTVFSKSRVLSLKNHQEWIYRLHLGQMSALEHSVRRSGSWENKVTERTFKRINGRPDIIDSQSQLEDWDYWWTKKERYNIGKQSSIRDNMLQLGNLQGVSIASAYF